MLKGAWVLTHDELEDSRLQMIAKAQNEDFLEEKQLLVKGGVVNKRSKIAVLVPFLDGNGLLRSNSRLVNIAYLPWNTTHPIILSKDHRVTELIIKQCHEDNKHVAGTNHLLSILSSEYWIVCAREAIRKWENKCNYCKKIKSTKRHQIMAPLPDMRTTMSLRAFSNIGCDFAGPFETVQGRGRARMKRYLCLFTCCEVRAVHLEMCNSLDTNSFINALWRFSARRGFPEQIVTDNGRNFVGAEKELREIIKNIDFEKVKEKLADQVTTWHFNPPYEPHSGGIFEIMIKASKRAMKAQFTSADVTDEELNTIIIIAEGLINSRPITYQSANPMDLTPLTPNHFLIGRAGDGVRIPTTDGTTMRRWRHIQEIINVFWQRWMREWIPSLAGRKKWRDEQNNVKVGDIALMISVDTERAKWPMGRIEEVFPGKDGRVRRVTIKIGDKFYDRGIQSICPLELARW